MPAGGELAALLARRAKASGEDNSSAGDDHAVNTDTDTDVKLKTLAAAGIAKAPPSPKPTAEPVHVSTPVRNEELKAIFEERNLEAGIPTPSFLVNARMNLKKPGSKEPPLSPARGANKKSDPSTYPKSTSACSSDNAVSNDGMASFIPLEGATSGCAGNIGGGESSIGKRNVNARTNSDILARRNRINASRSSTSSVSSHASMSSEIVGPAVTMAVSSLSGDVSEGVSNKKNIGRANSDSGYNPDTLAARRTRVNASRTSTSSASSNTSNPSNKSNPAGGQLKKASPAQMRRQIMATKIRVSRSNPSSSSENNSKQKLAIESAIPKTSVISPKRDEFEVLFADDDFVSPGDESMDSIVKEMHDMHESLLNGSYSTAASTATMPTNNCHLMIDDTVIDNTNTSTPEKSRIHNASTPKIRGNGHYKRENYDDHGVGEIGGSAFVGAARHLPRGAEVGSSQKRHSQSNSLPSYQEQHQTGSEDYLPYELPQKLTPHRTTNPHDQLPQAYPFRQSPSLMSQMSAITTPSCFPQEYLIPGSAQRGFGDLQQPVLMNETVGAKGSPIGIERPGVALGAMGPTERISAFSPRLEIENQRQREQLSSMARKLEEKDAIISQLMKRISDLELMNSSPARGSTLEYHVNTEGLGTPTSMHVVPHSTGTRSNGSTGEPFAMSPVWEHSQPVPQWSNSGDTESACLSGSSPQHSQQQPSTQKQMSLQQQAQQRRGRSSLNSAATSSTASVTTSNSSKSGRRSAPRSKSVSDSSRQSRKGEQGSGKQNKNDDRKFVC